ncbi:hypothetical protein F2P56_035638 [Juglans regia]|uniref:Uncharacterized protein LOC109000154 n=2 Tax=Juglans regia TaxID=51240 RepID=A0A2I4FLJ0_JUGRE|nr:uncharacterized protein LOC109000154 [Juglans regia]KAF5443043.1 hypothetical protein F2P56_035638 [Juglans regia]
MAKVWKISKHAVFHECGANVFTLTFATHADKYKVLDGKPWLFDNGLFALKLFDGLNQPNKIRFDCEEFWVQFHNLPLAYMNRVCGVQIGKTIGNVLEVDIPDDGIGWDKFLRIKIEMKLHQALPRGRMIGVKGDKVWIPIKYEKLPKVCFMCGYIAHEAGGCTLKSENLAQHAEKIMQFGPRLRAESTYSRRSYYSGKVSHGDSERWKMRPKEGGKPKTDSGEQNGENQGANSNSNLNLD